VSQEGRKEEGRGVMGRVIEEEYLGCSRK